MKKEVSTVECPKSMVGRVIGKNGETIRALQNFTGAQIQIDQTTDPMKVTISGSQQSLNVAISMVTDIVNGNFKGFAMLRQLANDPAKIDSGCLPIYVPGYGLVPPSQMYSSQVDANTMSSSTSAHLLTDPLIESLASTLPTASSQGKTKDDLTPSSYILGLTSNQTKPTSLCSAGVFPSSTGGISVENTTTSSLPLASLAMLSALKTTNHAEAVSPIGASSATALNAFGAFGIPATNTSTTGTENLSPSFLKMGDQEVNLGFTTADGRTNGVGNTQFSGSLSPELNWSNGAAFCELSSGLTTGTACIPEMQSVGLGTCEKVSCHSPVRVDQDASQLHRLSDFVTASSKESFSDISDSTDKPTSCIPTFHNGSNIADNEVVVLDPNGRPFSINLSTFKTQWIGNTSTSSTENHHALFHNNDPFSTLALKQALL